MVAGGAGHCFEAAERAGLFLSHARLALQALREHEPPLVWGGVVGAGGEELWWLLPDGRNDLERLELVQALAGVKTARPSIVSCSGDWPVSGVSRTGHVRVTLRARCRTT